MKYKILKFFVGKRWNIGRWHPRHGCQYCVIFKGRFQEGSNQGLGKFSYHGYIASVFPGEAWSFGTEETCPKFGRGLAYKYNEENLKRDLTCFSGLKFLFLLYKILKAKVYYSLREKVMLL